MLDSHGDTSVVNDDCLIIHDHSRPVNVFSHDLNDSNKCVRSVDAAVCNDNPYGGKKYILLIIQEIQISGLVS